MTVNLVEEKQLLSVNHPRLFNHIEFYFLGFLLYIIGYVFISLFSGDRNDYPFYQALCGTGDFLSATQTPFFKERCIPQILSAFILT